MTLIFKHENRHTSATTLKPLTGEVNNISIQWHLSSGGIYYTVVKVDVLEAGKMGNCKDLSDFDKSHM